MTKTITEIKEITEKILEGQTNLQHDIHEIKMSLFVRITGFTLVSARTPDSGSPQENGCGY